jgi:hypothetical protein
MLAVVDHYAFHLPLIRSVVLGVAVFGSLLFWRYTEEAEQRRRANVQQRPSNAEGQDASGG